MAKTILASAMFAVALACGATAFAEEPQASTAGASAPQAAPNASPSAAATSAAPAAEKAPEKAADPAAPETPSWETAPATRRGGFTVGVSLGGNLGNVTGYPNDVRKVGRAEYRTDTGAAFGGGGTLWLGGALADWLVFGAGLGGSQTRGNGAVVQGFTFVFHTEVFPLFPLGGMWRELGISIDTGLGSFTGEVENKPSGAAGKLVAPLIDSGAASRVGLGVFYDGFRLWKVSTGPFVAFDYTWSATLNQPLVFVGLRTALYTKAKVAPKR